MNMTFRDLFLAKARKPEAEGLAVAASTEPPPVVGVFITPESLATFPGASLAVTVVWVLMKKLIPKIGASPWIPVVASLVIGLVIFLTTISDDRVAPQNEFKMIFAVAVSLFYLLLSCGFSLGLL